MKIFSTSLLVAMCIAATGHPELRAQDGDTIYDEDVKLVRLEDLAYPVGARIARVQRVVHANPLGRLRRAALPPAILEVADQLLFFVSTEIVGCGVVATGARPGRCSDIARPDRDAGAPRES
jgi:hypothetical protein